MEFRTSTRLVGGQPTITLDGVVDLVAVPELRDALQMAVLKHPGTTLLIDLDGVVVFDDCGLGMMIGAAATARERGGDVELVCTNPAILDQLARTRVDRLFTVRATVA